MTLEELKNNEQEISDKASQLYAKLYNVVMLLKGDVSPVEEGEYKTLPGILGDLELAQHKTLIAILNTKDLLNQLESCIGTEKLIPIDARQGY